MRRPWAAAILFLALAAAPGARALETGRRAGEFSYQTWQTENGLPQNTVRSILQARDGYLWFATEDGLVRFDGYRFETFDAQNTRTLASSDIRALAEDRAGTLWVATGEGVVARSKDSFRAYGRESGLPFTNMLGLLAEKQATVVWAIAPNGVTRFGAGAPVSFALPEGFPRLTGAVAANGDGSVMLGTQAGLARLSGSGQFQEVAGEPGMGSVSALLRDETGALWAGTRNGLFRQANGARALAAVRAYAGRPVTALFEDREQTLWVGSGSDLERFGGAGMERSLGSRPMPGDTVLAIGEDSDGDVWVGTESAGVTVLRDQKFVTYTTRDGLAGDNVRCVFSGRDGATWVGSDRGLSRLGSDGRWRQWHTEDGLSSDVILSLAEDRAGNVYAGTPDGLNRIAPDGRITVTTSADGLPDDFIRSIYSDGDGSLWLGTRRGVAHVEGAGTIRTFTQADGLGSDLAGSVLRDRAGQLWVATLDGLSVERGGSGRFETYRTGDGLSSNVVTALAEDSRGNLWVGTQNGGLNLWRGGKFAAVPRSLGLPETIFGVLEDANGDLWMLGATGVVRAARDELAAAARGGTRAGSGQRATVVWYGTSDGLRVAAYGGAGHPGASRGADGSMWFSTLKGAAAVTPGAAQLNRVPPEVVLEAVSIDDKTFAPEQVNRIAPGHRRIAFEYAGLSFAAPQKVRYRYRLLPFDKDWIDGGVRRTAFYTNLTPGAYRFEVMARNNDGFWSVTPASLGLRLEPHFYQTYWFYALLGLLAAGAGYLAYRWRVAEVETRFNAVLAERNRIAREIHDTLAQGFIGVSVQLEIVSRLLAVSAESAKEQLDHTRVLVRESIAEARRSIWELRSHEEKGEDLPSRLSRSATQAVGNSAVKLSLQVRGAYRPLNRRIEDELLRIGQEAVMNALRHAEAERVDIELAFEAKALRMTVSDDGRGFAVREDGAGPEGHYGLRGMRERAQQIGAKLTVDSAIGKGTRVFVEAPVG
jgi:signal transduction histidine kinase/ligand-binding sensor domain-containing protein